MSYPKIVALSGESGSGKDTIGREVFAPMGYRQFALAWHMKHEALGGLPGNGAIVVPSYEDVMVNKPPMVREWLQQRGTEHGWMKYGEAYWLRIAEGWMHTLGAAWGIDRFYFTDVRFPHEVRWIEGLGGVVFRLTGRGGLTGIAREHPSERALDGYPFKYFIDNSGPVAVTSAAIRRILSQEFGNV